jgi:hypothetical protein
MERYTGLDAHGQSCTFAVMGPSGRRIRHDVVETNGAALVRYVKALAGRKHLCLEEGTQSGWLYEICASPGYRPAFTMTETGVHDHRNDRSPSSETAVHVRPRRAVTILRNTQEKTPSMPGGGMY